MGRGDSIMLRGSAAGPESLVKGNVNAAKNSNPGSVQSAGEEKMTHILQGIPSELVERQKSII